jgi:Uma2 family endonuclease
MKTTQLPPLVEGQQLDQATFHALYEAMPERVKAELIGGIVRMASPVHNDHVRALRLVYVSLDYFADRVLDGEALEAMSDVTTILSPRDEVQPDVQLRIRAEYGGMTRDDPGYIAGTPELVVEVSGTSRNTDLGRKRDAYGQAGVSEYIVVDLENGEVIWHVLRDGQLIRVDPDADGFYRSVTFPGLWLDPAALLANDRRQFRRVIDRGVASPEHAAFLIRLAAAREGQNP